MLANTSANRNDKLFLSDTLLLAQELLVDILQAISAVTGFTPDLETIRNGQISVITEDISRFVEVTSLVSKVLMEKNKELQSRIKNSHIHLLFIMKALNQAQLKQDLVALEELIKYELKDNLTQWKIDLIPQTKRLLPL